MIVYEMKDVNYRIGDKKLVEIEHLGLQKAEILGVIGPNGAGKSTLLKLMALLEEPSAGTIHYREQQVYPGTPSLLTRRQLATVFQRSFLLDTNVYNNIAVGLKIRKISKQERKERIEKWMELFRVDTLRHQHAHTLSGGEAQRVSLARALVLEPDILFLDEPFSALDFPTKVELMKDLKQILQESQITTVFVSHDLLEIKYLTNKVLVLMNGKIEQMGATGEVIQYPNERTASFLDIWRELSLL